LYLRFVNSGTGRVSINHSESGGRLAVIAHMRLTPGPDLLCGRPWPRVRPPVAVRDSWCPGSSPGL